MPVRKFIKFAALIVLMPAFALADVVVTHFEPIQQLQVSETDNKPQSFLAQSPQPSLQSLSFQALGRKFDLQLETNDRVATGLEITNHQARIQVYKGQLRNVAGSWVRIVMFDGVPSGIISDGAELFAIDSPADSTLSIESPVIYRFADAHITPGTMSCAADGLAGRASTVAKTVVGASKSALARGPGALSEITMSTIGDFEFTSLRGGDVAASAAIATRMNNVDGYFSEQIGVQITVAQPIETHSDAEDPFTSTGNSDELLDELSEYRLQTSSHNSAGLTHLWTGRDLEGTTVGIAWRGALCADYFGAGLSEGTANAFIDSLIAAHEIGHNFGAEHDGEPGTSCPDANASFIMSASVNGSEEFSDCSIDVIQAEAAAAACVTALPTVDVSIVPASDFSNLLLGVSSDIQYQVSSNGTLEVTGVEAGVLLPVNLSLDSATTSVGSCSSGAGIVDCDLGNLAGLSTETITLTVTPVLVGTGAVTATVSTTGNDERAGNNQDVSPYGIQAPVDLVARQPSAPDVLLDSSTTVTANIDNLSALDATNVRASVVLENGIQAASANWSIGACTVTAQQVDCEANRLDAMSSSTLSVTVNAVLRGRRDVTVTLTSTEPDATPQNNSTTGEVVVRLEEQKDDDDGGGSTNPALLLLGLTTVFVSRRRAIRKVLL